MALCSFDPISLSLLYFFPNWKYQLLIRKVFFKKKDMKKDPCILTQSLIIHSPQESKGDFSKSKFITQFNIAVACGMQLTPVFDANECIKKINSQVSDRMLKQKSIIIPEGTFLALTVWDSHQL